MMLNFAFSTQGYNHIKANKVCQDASGSYSDENMSVAVVADGHGSDNYPRTDRGSKYAVDSAITATGEFVSAVYADNMDISENSGECLEQLAKSILSLWYDSVVKDVAEHPFSEEELEKVSDKYRNRYISGNGVEKAYGTTLILVCVTRSYWFGMQIGDGKCVAFSKDGEVFEPIPWDEECQSNVTTSICDSDAIDEFRFYFSKELPLAVFAGCDGIDDSYASDEELYSLYRSVLTVFAEHGDSVGISEVEEFLPALSRKGSGDDVSIAGLITPDFSVQTIELIKTQSAYASARIEYKKAEKNVTSATERLEYVIDSTKKAKLNYESVQNKETETRHELERAKNELNDAVARLQEAETALTVAKNKIKPVDDNCETSDVGARWPERSEGLNNIGTIETCRN